MTDVIESLVQDHRTVDGLFDQYRSAAGGAGADDTLREIVRQLSVHAAIEEQIVYPVLRATVDDGSEKADHSIDEHQQVKRLLADLEKLETGSTEHDDRFEGLVAAVQEHVTEEEGELFPQLRAAVDAERLQQMGNLVEQARGLMPTHPHPNVPGTATAQLAAAPFASMADHIRDFISGIRRRGDGS